MNNEDREYIHCVTIARETRTAKYYHACVCGKRIDIGERYIREFGVVDGEPFISKCGWHLHEGE